jgi:hypothetical protein
VEETSSFCFCDSLVLDDVVEEFTALRELGDEVEGLWCLDNLERWDKEESVTS